MKLYLYFCFFTTQYHKIDAKLQILMRNVLTSASVFTKEGPERKNEAYR